MKVCEAAFAFRAKKCSKRARVWLLTSLPISENGGDFDDLQCSNILTSLIESWCIVFVEILFLRTNLTCCTFSHKPTLHQAPALHIVQIYDHRST